MEAVVNGGGSDGVIAIVVDVDDGMVAAASTTAA
jgi:hypothetical protein